MTGADPAEPVVVDLGLAAVGQRLDRALVDALREAGRTISRNGLRASFDAGDVTDGTRVLRPSFEVREPTRVLVRLHAPAPLTAKPEPVPLVILHEDEDVLVIDKAAGIVVHPSPGHPGGTLVNGVLHHLGQGRPLPVLPGNDDTRPGVVHRLDRDTSGVMVFTKSPEAAASLAEQFRQHTIERSYVGVLHGSPSFHRRTLDTTHGRDPADRKRFAPVPGASRRAVSHVSIIETMHAAAVARFHLETGRTHQIRMHARHLGCPIFGDVLYGNAPREPSRRRLWVELRRHALHAEVLGFVHPRSGVSVRYESALPPELVGLLDALRNMQV